MKQKLEKWCYGGKSKAFYMEQIDAIHQYNTKMLEQLLLIMTIILGCYVVSELCFSPIIYYLVTYLIFFSILLIMLCFFKHKVYKSIAYTRVYILIFAFVMFVFVCLIGTVFEPDARAIMFIVYILVLPMLFVIPTHYTYGFLGTATIIFSTISLSVKNLEYAQMDVAHGITCLVIGIFISHHILKSRITLYALNELLDAHNLKLGEQLQEKEQQLLQSRISILLSQIQPHFLYNTLTIICGLCDENPKRAKKVTSEFADYLRHNLDTLNQNTSIPFSDELQHTKLYISIEKERFEEKLRVTYDIQTHDFHIPPLTIQPLVENAIKHGVLKRKKGGTVTISTRNLDSHYEVIIRDDGVGFDANKQQTDNKAHIGIENVRDRLYSMCLGTLTIESEVGQGTTAIIKIPKGDPKQ